MLLSVFAWALISFFCFTWGFLTCRIISVKKPIRAIVFPSFSMLCLSGLAVTGVIGLYLSIAFPINDYVQLFFAVPPILCWLLPAYRKAMTIVVLDTFRFSRPALLIFLISVVMILVISSHSIIHPDTLAYHLQSIRWFESFKAVPGIVNIDEELGFQSLWFCTQAIFRLKFFEDNFIFFLNGAVLCWYFMFVCKLLDFQDNKKSWNLAALFLLTFSLLSWTCVRLTAASASPDFIVCIYILAAAYLLLQPGKNDASGNALVILFTVTAVLIKLSAIAILILPLYLVWASFRTRQFRRGLMVILAGMIMLLPLLIRNIIATGYVLYPSAIADFWGVPWKKDLQALAGFRGYIQAYARVADHPSVEGPWVLLWWTNLSIADKGLIGLLLLLLLIGCFRAGMILQRLSSKERWLMFSAIAGIILWWFMAPDPRFGMGYLLLLVMLLGALLFNTSRLAVNKKTLLVWAWMVCIGTTGYTVYRFSRFFEIKQVLVPLGTPIGNYTTLHCAGVPIHVPVADTLCKGIPAPCVVDSCTRIIPLGKTIEAGFSSSK